MPQSLSKLDLHAIFQVKNNECLIRQEDEKELYAYMGSLIISTLTDLNNKK
jgi:hypothetical protein